MMKVSGKVLSQGKPLPGGRVTFFHVNGEFASSGQIDESGNYQLEAPVGDVQISVMIGMLQSSSGPKWPYAPKKAGAEKSQSLKGRWIRIPSHFEDPLTSGLKFTVKPGPQTHDIVLSDKARPASPAPEP